MIAVSGFLGALVAIGHGILCQRFIVRPLETAPIDDLRQAGFRKLFVGPLIHVSTFTWLAGGLGLIFAATSLSRDALLAVSVVIQVSYTHAALLNIWTARGRHYGGWCLAGISALLASGIIELAG